MAYAIIATVALAFVYFPAAFIHHCIASIQARRALFVDSNKMVGAAHIPDPSKMVAQPLEITPVIEPMSFGEGVELSIDIPTSIRALKKFVRTHSLQQAVREYAGKPYSYLSLAQLSEAVGVAIAA